MKTKNYPTPGALRRTAWILTAAMLPALLAAQTTKPFPIQTEDDVLERPALKEVAFLGVSTHGIEAALAAQMDLPPETGLVVVHVMPDGPAAGVLKEHDLLTRFEDQILIEPRQLGVLVRSRKEGDTVKLTLFRSGKQQTVSVKLSKRAMPPLPGSFVPGARRVIGDAGGGEPFMIRRGGESRVSGYGSHEMRISRFEGKDATMVFDDGKGRLEITFKDGKKHLAARNAKGDSVFEGPVETPEERKALPADVRARLETMEALDVHLPAPPPPPGVRGDVLRAAPGVFHAPGGHGHGEPARVFPVPPPGAESDAV